MPRRFVLSAITVVALAAGVLAPATVATAAPQVSALRLLDTLSVVKESKASSYDRGKFKLWVDANKDCQNTRAEVLITESRKHVSGKCTVKTGKWVSMYDGKVIKTASKLDIDHMVPLAEAWASGAAKWSASRRQAFANDTGYSWSLVAVTAKTNRSKGDSDPAEWLPAKNTCQYAKVWVGVKYRWGLSVDKAEASVLHAIIEGCSNKTIAKPSKPNISKLVVKTTAKKTITSTTKKKSSSSGTDRNYGTCTAAIAAGANTPYYRGIDPEYGWYRDRDGDGIVCE